MTTILILFFGLPGGAEWLIILAVVLLIFGGTKIPQLMKGIGQGVHEFKKGISGKLPESNEKP